MQTYVVRHIQGAKYVLSEHNSFDAAIEALKATKAQALRCEIAAKSAAVTFTKGYEAVAATRKR